MFLIRLCGHQFVRLECNWLFHLWYYIPKLCLWDVHVYHKLFWEVLIHKDSIFSNDTFNHPKGLFLNFRPFEYGVCCCDLCQWRKNMCTSRPHILIVVNKSHKYLHLSYNFGKLDIGNGFHLLCQWFDLISCDPKSKVFTFVATEELFSGIDFQSCLKDTEE